MLELKDGNVNLIILEDQMALLGEKIEELSSETGVTCVLLIDSAGKIIVSSGKVENLDLTVIAALSSGDYATARELAKRVGEREFSLVFQRENQLNAYLNAIGEDALVVILFEKEAALGQIRIRVKATQRKLKTILEQCERKVEGPEFMEASFSIGVPEQTAGVPEQTAGVPEQTAGVPEQTAGAPEEMAPVEYFEEDDETSLQEEDDDEILRSEAPELLGSSRPPPKASLLEAEAAPKPGVLRTVPSKPFAQKTIPGPQRPSPKLDNAKPQASRPGPKAASPGPAQVVPSGPEHRVPLRLARRFWRIKKLADDCLLIKVQERQPEKWKAVGVKIFKLSALRKSGDFEECENLTSTVEEDLMRILEAAIGLEDHIHSAAKQVEESAQPTKEDLVWQKIEFFHSLVKETTRIYKQRLDEAQMLIMLDKVDLDSCNRYPSFFSDGRLGQVTKASLGSLQVYDSEKAVHTVVNAFSDILLSRVWVIRKIFGSEVERELLGKWSSIFKDDWDNIGKLGLQKACRYLMDQVDKRWKATAKAKGTFKN